jgi:hypothetical protein
MVVKILSSAASFKGVSYNTNKIDNGKGELMKVSGFGPLQILEHVRPEDYKNYLKMLSATNKAVSKPQLHAVISANGKEYDKAGLTAIAENWLKSMGYGDQPCLVVYHNDTGNNHVHVVSTRIDRNGKKISSGFENIRAIQNLNKILGIDERYSAKQDMAAALSYNYSTKAQLMMILESKGYTLKYAGDKLDVIKYGLKQGEIGLSEVDNGIKKHHLNPRRINQVKALFTKYAAIYDTALKSGSNGFTSDFSKYLKDKHGLVLLFHAKDDKPPYGYSIIDHSGKAVYKGSEVMALKNMLAVRTGKQYFAEAEEVLPEKESSADLKAYYAAILKAALYSYPDLVQGLQHQGLQIISNGANLTLVDQGAGCFIPVDELLNDKDYGYLVSQVNRHQEYEQFERDIPGVNITDDVDDQQIHGMRRRRQQKARTNTR